MVEHPVSFVSLGPGDPELITVKGLKRLQAADIIYCPSTLLPNGKTASRAARILHESGIEEAKINLFILPMHKERNGAQQAYDQLLLQTITSFEERKKIVIVAEGDAGFYSSIQYVYDRLLRRNIPVERIAGIPAFIAAGSVAGLHIVKQEEQLLVIPGTATPTYLSEKLEEGKIIVIMKLSQCSDAIRNCIDAHPEKTFHYFENIGTEQEFYTSDRSKIATRSFPYFSLLIIQ